MKVNVDAPVGRGASHGVVGAVCRDQTCMFLGASTVVLPNISDPTTLEALAIRGALALADDLHERKLHVAFACRLVMEDIQ